jgi:hypothetical protein
MPMAQKNKPVHEIRLGRIRAAIWANQTEADKVRFGITVSRLYRDGDRWHDSQTYYHDDLLVVSKIVHMAYVWIWDQEGSSVPFSSIDEG